MTTCTGINTDLIIETLGDPVRRTGFTLARLTYVNEHCLRRFSAGMIEREGQVSSAVLIYNQRSTLLDTTRGTFVMYRSMRLATIQRG